MSFSCIFTQIFDFGYGINVCQYLNGEECAETVSQYLKKKKINFKRLDTGHIEIKILDTPRYFLSENPVTSCGFVISENHILGHYIYFHFKRKVIGTNYYTSASSYRWTRLDPDNYWYIWIKCKELNLKGLRKYQEKERVIQEEASRKVAQEAAFIAHTLKPKSWAGRPKF